MFAWNMRNTCSKKTGFQSLKYRRRLDTPIVIRLRERLKDLLTKRRRRSGINQYGEVVGYGLWVMENAFLKFVHKAEIIKIQ